MNEIDNIVNHINAFECKKNSFNLGAFINSKINKNYSNDKDRLLIERKKINYETNEVLQFINFCIKEKLFDDTYYDYNYEFSVISTKITKVFSKFSNDVIAKPDFANTYSNYPGNIYAIYDFIDQDQKQYITYDEMANFFLSYVKTITIKI